MEISPLPLAQVLQGRDGRRYEISGDAAAIVTEIRRLDDTLHVQFNEAGMFFVVYQTLNEHRVPDPDGDIEEVVLRVAMNEWDRRVVDYVQMRAWEMRNGKSANDRLDAAHDAAKREKDRALEEAVGAHAERMFRSAQRDLGTKPRIYIPQDWKHAA